MQALQRNHEGFEVCISIPICDDCMYMYVCTYVCLSVYLCTQMHVYAYMCV